MIAIPAAIEQGPHADGDCAEYWARPRRIASPAGPNAGGSAAPAPGSGGKWACRPGFGRLGDGPDTTGARPRLGRLVYRVRSRRQPGLARAVGPPPRRRHSQKAQHNRSGRRPPPRRSRSAAPPAPPRAPDPHPHRPPPTYLPRALALLDSLIGSRAYFVMVGLQQATSFFLKFFGCGLEVSEEARAEREQKKNERALPSLPPHSSVSACAHTRAHPHTQRVTHPPAHLASPYPPAHNPSCPHSPAHSLCLSPPPPSMDAFSPAAGAAPPAFALPASAAPATFEVQHTVGHM